MSTEFQTLALYVWNLKHDTWLRLTNSAGCGPFFRTWEHPRRIKQLPSFKGHDGSLPCSQEPATGTQLSTTWIYVGFQVLTVVSMKSIIFWVVTPCSPLKVNRRFGGACRFQRIRQVSNQQDLGSKHSSKFLRQIRELLPIWTGSILHSHCYKNLKLNNAIIWRNSPLLDNGSLKARFVATNTLVEFKALPRDWHTFRSNGWKQIITDVQFKVVVSLWFAPNDKREFIRESSFVRELRVQCSAVECYPADNGSWRCDRFANQKQASHSGREDIRSPVRNGASLRQSVIVSCYNWF
jgi:hypothetical protein